MVNNQEPRPTRQPTVQDGRGFPFGGLRDDRWQDCGGTVERPGLGWWWRGWPKRPPLVLPGTTPHQPVAPSNAPLSPAAGDQRLGRYAVPLLILAVALATSSIVLPLVALVLWLQRRKLAPNFSPPWEDPARVRAWAERYRATNRLADKPPPAGLAHWLKDPPYADPMDFRLWINQRLAQALLALCGLILILKVMAALADRADTIAPGVI